MRQVKKRNGAIVDFEPVKITVAVRKAFIAMNVPVEEAHLSELTDIVVADIDATFIEATPSIENIQDSVERALVDAGHFDIAKHYMLYRYTHEKIREEKQQEVIEKAASSKLMVVRSNGTQELFDVKKIRAVLAEFIPEKDASFIDIEMVLKQLNYELFEGISTKDISRALVAVVRSKIEVDPAYSRLAARLLLHRLYGDVFGADYQKHDIKEIHARIFERNIRNAVEKGFLDERMLGFDFKKITDAFVIENDYLFEYMGLEVMASRYCMEDLENKKPLETPQMFWMRIAMGLSLNEKEENKDRVAIDFYGVMGDFYYAPGGRTLFQAGMKKAQLANCFLNSVPDSLEGIMKTMGDNAQYLKWSGGLGTDWTKVRAMGSFIKGTGVPSQGIVPFLKIANDLNIAINRSGKRRGAGCVYLESWHMDIEDFLELRKNTGDERRRTHDLNTANWIPDLFMKRVRDNGEWTLFSPEEVPELHEIYGAAFEKRYMEYEKLADEGKIKMFKRVSAAELWKKMLAMLFETGHAWITWKDPSNVRSPQDHAGVVHNSNLCTEITLNTSDDETAVCNLGSLNLARFVVDGKFDTELLGRVTKISMRMLDNIIDLNYYPTPDAKLSNTRHRPVGLGVRGYHDALYMLGINFDTHEAVAFANESMEAVAYYAILGSSELAKEKGAYETYKGSKWDRNIFPQDTIELLAQERGERIDVSLGGSLDWAPVRAHVKEYGMRNSNTMAIAPTASTALLVGCIPCVEPIYQNIYVKSNKEGEFIVVNKYLIEDLKQLGLWNDDMLNKLKFADGSVQGVPEIPQHLKDKYKTVFEIDQKWIIDAAAERGKWIDQSQSLNIFFSGTSGKDLSDIYFNAWKKGLKTTYYLRSLGASQVEKATVSTAEFGSTHLRGNATSADATAVFKEEVVVEEVPPAPTLSPAEMAERLARVAAGDEVGLCESCQG